jgi:acyl-CoA dehydrogenase
MERGSPIPEPRSTVEVRKIDKMGRNAVDSNVPVIDGLEIPEEDRIGGMGCARARSFEADQPESVNHALKQRRVRA